MLTRSKNRQLRITTGSTTSDNGFWSVEKGTRGPDRLGPLSETRPNEVGFES